MHSLEQNILQIYGDKGKAWLQALPSVVETLAKQWNLTRLIPVNNLSYNYVLMGYQGIVPIALKISCEQEILLQEYNALKIYNGYGCVRVLESDFTYNALLLEQMRPGTLLKSLFPKQDDTAVTHAVSVMKQLHTAVIPSNIHFPTIKGWLQRLYNPNPSLSLYHIYKAQKLAQKLLDTQAESVLLHGDLHYENILLSERGWLAIDPKGVIGEPAYEVGAFIRNPYPELLMQENPDAIMQRRLELFAEQLSIDKLRLHQWSYVQAVLAGCWAMHDGQTDPVMALAEADLLNNLF